MTIFQKFSKTIPPLFFSVLLWKCFNTKKFSKSSGTVDSGYFVHIGVLQQVLPFSVHS